VIGHEGLERHVVHRVYMYGLYQVPPLIVHGVDDEPSVEDVFATVYFCSLFRIEEKCTSLLDSLP
jgi:hypothetical protein